MKNFLKFTYPDAVAKVIQTFIIASIAIITLVIIVAIIC